MNREQYIESLRRLGLSQVAAAKFLKRSDRTCRRWVAGASPVPHAVALLFWIMLKHGITPADLADIR